jgi:hypothetical protein
VLVEDRVEDSAYKNLGKTDIQKVIFVSFERALFLP